uniref:Uncharacterized protein n=1 Tax=Anguilla anguilla TaxID=7936 RepID=A0A0E9T2N1_ANGAN
MIIVMAGLPSAMLRFVGHAPYLYIIVTAFKKLALGGLQFHVYYFPSTS